MKNNIWSLFLIIIFAAALFYPFALSAQPENRLEKNFEMLKDKLALTPAQSDTIKIILTDAQKKMQECRKKYTDDRKEMFKAAQEIMEQTDKSIEALLTKDQKEVYAQIVKERKEKMKSFMKRRR